MDAKVAKAMYGDMADQGAPRKKKEAHCSWFVKSKMIVL
jgi:hypothetical protein